MQNVMSFSQVKKCSDVCKVDYQQMKTPNFCRKYLFRFALSVLTQRKKQNHRGTLNHKAFGHENLVNTKLATKVFEKSKSKDFYLIENF
jgi:hypothetical protein